MTEYLEDKVILDVIYVLVISQETYPESFMLISLLEVGQEGGSFIGLLWGH